VKRVRGGRRVSRVRIMSRVSKEGRVRRMRRVGRAERVFTPALRRSRFQSVSAILMT
jgi:hypothetical protein